jgi:hypothetical protein
MRCLHLLTPVLPEKETPMGARGYNIVQEGHIVPLVLPENISGGVKSAVFSMRNAAKTFVLLTLGALSAAEGNVQLFACTDLNGDNPVAIGFDLWTQAAGGNGNDVMGVRQAILPAGYVPADTPGIVAALHVQADQLPNNCPYLYVTIGDGTDADYACAVAVLTGVRYQGESNQSATV